MSEKMAIIVPVLMFVSVVWPGASYSQSSTQHAAFVTSVSGDADLSTWIDANGAIGLRAADNICSARATEAGLSSPEEYVAWLSDTLDDAYCRVHGQGGKKADDCGQPSLPEAAGPWVNLAGYPFLDQINLALEPIGLVYAPVSLDDLRNPTSQTYFTNTSDAGVLASQFPGACDDWMGTTGQVFTGDPKGGTTFWTRGPYGNCSDDHPLLCLRKGPGEDLPPLPEVGATTFVTSAFGTGDFNLWPEASGSEGIAAADAICQQLASDANLRAPESFVAWISDSTMAVVNAVDRMVYSGPWIRLDRVLIAHDTADLTDGTLFSTLNLTEQEEYLTFGGNGYLTWTGTSTEGVSTGEDCSGWTSSAENATVGYALKTDYKWAEYFTTASCDWTDRRLYCFSQSPNHVFLDGFESGNVDAWR